MAAKSFAGPCTLSDGGSRRPCPDGDDEQKNMHDVIPPAAAAAAAGGVTLVPAAPEAL